MVINVAPLLKHPIGSRVDYHLSEAPIDPRGENAGLLDAGVASIDADVKATHTNPGPYFEGDARARVALQCSRCLRPMDLDVQAHFAEQYYATIHVDTGAELDEAPLDAKTVGSDFRVDLVPLLREELILATPQAPLCRPDCRGLCPVCGEDLNVRPHEHEEVVDDRWAELRGLHLDEEEGERSS